MYKEIPIEEYRALIKSKKEAILELLKGLNFEQVQDIIEVVTKEIDEIKSQSILL